MKREREDAKALALAAIIVPTTWLLLLGWSWERCVAGHDGLCHSLPLLQRDAIELCRAFPGDRMHRRPHRKLRG